MPGFRFTYIKKDGESRQLPGLPVERDRHFQPTTLEELKKMHEEGHFGDY
jgi:hypothetical protein